MMKFLIFTILFFVTSTAQAEIQLIFGGGLSSNSIDANIDTLKATYRSQGYLGEVGFIYKIAPVGLMISAESGKVTGNNTVSSTTQIEKFSNDYSALKFGMFFGPVGFGYGQRANSIQINSVSSAGTDYQQNYSGTDAFPFVALHLNSGAMLSSLEAQYHSANIQSLGQKELSIQLKLFFTFSNFFGGGASSGSSGEWKSKEF
jgi:hypothetical protein